MSIKAVCGGASIGRTFADEESIEKMYKLLEEGGCNTIDTARIYGDSEDKAPGGFIAGSSTSTTIPQFAKETVERLRTSVDVYYLHAPDASVELEDQLKGINEAYTAGYFKRFGISNFKAVDVQRVYDICKAKGYPLPTVYQGSYSAVTRIAFYALQPYGRRAPHQDRAAAARRAARMLDASPKAILRTVLYSGLYNKPSYYKALDLWEEAAKDAGCSRAELAYRWVAFDSAVDGKYGDAIIFGASKHSQISETLAWLKAWVIEHEAPLDNYHH
ncbi:Aldo/keto reductase [Mycena sanguinolenta]|uniref:Aldo/keto reductase n=1 Tax=Mycena sanguinolenta TaxID=230812 RepID=A0A8H6XBP4_9AGAR|nr:Aldo/keto reductase [Mycena sanguinolenta]